MRCAIYARVSTLDQHVENQLTELRSYVERRGWTAVEYVDKGVSGAKDRRPALDELLKAAKRRKFDVLVAWRLDRLGRNLRHLILLLDELHALGVAFVSLAEGIDATTPAAPAPCPRSYRGVRAREDSGARQGRSREGEGPAPKVRTAGGISAGGAACPSAGSVGSRSRSTSGGVAGYGAPLAVSKIPRDSRAVNLQNYTQKGALNARAPRLF
jgi:hypothetical protein